MGRWDPRGQLSQEQKDRIPNLVVYEPDEEGRIVNVATGEELPPDPGYVTDTFPQELVDQHLSMKIPEDLDA